MYDWLDDALHSGGEVVTANRRLGRELVAEFDRQQRNKGRLAWRSPAILGWQDWLARLLSATSNPDDIPTRINAHHSRILWERCLRREINDPLVNIAMLVRQSREAWGRLREFSVPTAQCAEEARGRDQRIFARAAGNYESVLAREQWTDEAGIGDVVLGLIEKDRVILPRSVTLAGFDRLVPQVQAVMTAARARGTAVSEAPTSTRPESGTIWCYENSEAELRAAGGWARHELEKLPGQRIGIVSTGLENNSDRSARLVREGFAPGWQFGGPAYRSAVNVSYGRKLTEYPLVSIGLLLLRWLHVDLSSREISLLLRSDSLGGSDISARSRLELGLRELPERRWSPAMLLREASGKRWSKSASGWLRCLEALDEVRRSLPRRQAPSDWAAFLDEVLGLFEWPGNDTLDSSAFQVVNRWRELLNDFARLGIVTDSLTVGEALSRLNVMAGETVFQPESEGALVHLLGPLEAAGMEFDKIWIAGMSSAAWPPAGRALALVSRSLQRRHGMPDSDPGDTLAYAQRVLARLIASAPEQVCSFALTEGDAEQTASGLLAHSGLAQISGATDPDWNARRLAKSDGLRIAASDVVPPVMPDERVYGGSASLQRQLSEPFSAFVYGRLGVRPIPSMQPGLSHRLRGILIHDALNELYSERPTHAEVAAWNDDVKRQRKDAAVRKAFSDIDRNVDPVLHELLELEKLRVRRLLDAVIELDIGREPFAIVALEKAEDVSIGGIHLQVRVDRIDRLDDGEVVILDYKTGQRRRFLGRDGTPKDMQLVVYACAVDDPISDLGLVNIDSRTVDLSGAGKTFSPDIDWNDALNEWREEVERAGREMSAGDVRINGLQNRQAARPLALLSRIAELKNDG